MANTNEKKLHNPSPAVVSAGCLGFRSHFSLCRGSSNRRYSLPSPPEDSHPQPAIPSSVSLFRDGEASAAAYWRKAKQLKEELRNLDKWLAIEKGLTEDLKNTTMPAPENTARMATLKLSDGSYLHEIKKLGRPWGRLAMQVSTPLIAEESTDAAEVIRGMASCKREELCKCMRESMPMCNLNGHQQGQIKGKKVALGSEDDFVEGILLSSMDNMEGLALEGLRIQMGASGGAVEAAEETARNTNEECGVIVMLVQIRDPKEKYEAVGEPMIGFVEAELTPAAAGRKYDVKGVHVAGMKRTQRRAGGRDFIWSTSIRGCKGLHNICCCCTKFIRNPDRFFHDRR
ncbi:hypothetical protein Cni_G27829 [Canna indica]|uniref:PMI1/PMIR1-2 C-terminal domain-containing protein n=1 Tax=Canna indica TaxID=4628 RepID=A0AAQ3L1H1_9LILI|nr:hypothetical protein Cni_G27829 [Canna indica]